MKKGMTGRKRHGIDFPRIPGADDMTATIGFVADLIDQLRNLVDGTAIWRTPIAPLCTVDAAQVAIRIGPFVPDGNTMLLQPFDIGIAAQKPE